VAATWNTNTQLLWYRADVVPNPPATWDEMIQMAKQLAQANKPHFIEEQGAQYEGLTVWFNSLVASAGGSILNDTSTSPSLGQPALQALQILSDLARSPAADPSLSNAMEDTARLAMEGGTAAFEINYPYVYPAMKKDKPDLFKNFKWAPYPTVAAGQTAKVTIGGLDLAVSAYAPHPDLAFQAALCLRNRPNQELLAVKAGFPPTLRSIYTQPSADFTAAYPFYQDILTQVDGGAVRPQTPAYQNISIVLSHTLSPPGSIKPQSALKTLRSQISDALQSKGLIP
jgi:multiple sugar transport system substrate-binding protein